MAYQGYLDDLCPGCGWPRTYTTHKDGAAHWNTPEGGVRCHGCAARDKAEKKARDNKHVRSEGLGFPTRPDEGMWHAMSDPILTYDDRLDQVGASGVDYSTPD